MKKLLTFLMFFLLAAIAAQAGTKTLKFENIGTNAEGTTVTKNTTISLFETTEEKNYDFIYYQGKKQGNAILLNKSVNAFIANSTAIPGNIKSVNVYINSGASNKTTYYCAFSTTACTKALPEGTAQNIAGGNSYTFTNSTSGCKYFCISLGNANNGQVLSIDITYEDNSTPSGPTLSSIAVKTPPTKVTYMEGQTFAPTGLVITKTMSNNETEDVTYSSTTASDFTFTPSLSTELTNQTSVTIGYGGKTTTQAITVNAIPTYTLHITQPTEGGILTVKNGDDVITDGTSVRVGTNLTCEVTEIPAGKRFSRFYFDYADQNKYKATNPATFEDLPTEGFTEAIVRVTYKDLAQYTINWSVNGKVTSQTIYEGTSVTVPVVNTIGDMVFTGWVTTSTVDADVTPAYVTPATTATANATYYAVFAKKEGTTEGYTKANSLNNGDQIILALESENNQPTIGVTGFNDNNKDATVSEEETTWLKFTVNKVQVNLDGVESEKYVLSVNNNYLRHEDKNFRSKENYTQSSSSKISSFYDVTSNSELISGLNYIFAFNSNNGTFYRFYATSTLFEEGELKSGYNTFKVWNLGSINYSNFTTLVLPTISVEHHSKFMPTSSINSYKNNVSINNLVTAGTYTLTCSTKNSSKNVATITINNDGTYTISDLRKIYATQFDATRFDDEIIKEEGYVKDGILVNDYYRASTATTNGGDEAGTYTYAISELQGVISEPINIPAGKTYGYLVSDIEKNKIGYTLSEILNDDKDASLNVTEGVALYHDGDQVEGSIVIYRYDQEVDNVDASLVREEGEHKLYYHKFSSTLDGKTSLRYALGYKIDNNTYGTEEAVIPILPVYSNLATNPETGTPWVDWSGPHPITGFDLSKSMYFYNFALLLSVNKDNNPFTLADGGYRVWRTCKTAYEPKGAASRATNTLFYEEFGALNIDDEVITPYNNDNNFGAYTAPDNTEVSVKVRTYYTTTSASSAPALKVKTTENNSEQLYYIAQHMDDIKFAGKSPITGIEDVEVAGNAVKAYKVIENGQVIIVRGDQRFNIMGQPVR